MRIHSFIQLSLLLLPFAVASAGPIDMSSTGKETSRSALDIKDKTTRINYSLGYQIGGDFKKQGVTLDPQAVVQGIEDALKGGQPQLSQPEMLTVLRELKGKIVAQQRSIQRDMELKYIAQDKKFLEENKAKPGVKTTASGLQYKIVEPGKGKRPRATDTVSVNYRGTLTNKQEFDSSHDRGGPASFPLDGVIKGWTEGLQLIKEGGKIQLIVPTELAYNDRGPLAHRALIFDVELVSVSEPKSVKAETAKSNKPE